MERNTRLLRNPKGTEGLIQQEALTHLKLVHNIEKVFMNAGYLPSQVPTFDYFDVYQDFYKDDLRIFRMFDRDGELLVLRSDITLFLAKQLGMSLNKKDLPLRIFYADSILRHQGQTDISKDEFFQVGAELVGVNGIPGDFEILSMTAQVMKKIGVDYYCHVGSRAFFDSVCSLLSKEEKKEVAAWIQGREIEKAMQFLEQSGGFSHDGIAILSRLFSYIGDSKGFKILLHEAEKILSPEIIAECQNLIKLVDKCDKEEIMPHCRLDLSEIGKMPYYTGMVFSLYVDGVDSEVGSGGRYDKMLEHFGFKAPSVGFSLLLRKLEQSKNRNGQKKEKSLTIALPKGRLQKKIQELLAERNVEILFEDRKLVAYDKEKRFKFILVKNGDLPTYVNYGIAGIGICGSDVLYESGFHFYKPLTFSFGRTTMCLAGVKGENHWKQERPLRVSSKFTKFTRDYYNSLGIPVEIVKLNGSVELGAVLGLTPYIVDLVETGSTLVANNLEVFEKLKEIQVKMVCNPAYYKIHYQKINELVELLQER